MKVKELIELLKTEDQELDIRLAFSRKEPTLTVKPLFVYDHEIKEYKVEALLLS